MDTITRMILDQLHSGDRDIQNKVFFHILDATEKRVDWAYELVEGLRQKDNHVRAIWAQVLCNLAKSDSENRMLKDFDALLAVTKDERFVTTTGRNFQACGEPGEISGLSDDNPG